MRRQMKTKQKEPGSQAVRPYLPENAHLCIV